MKNKKIHFVGIGGIGTSSLAQYYLSRGFTVSGSDLNENETTQALRQKGTLIEIGPHRAQNIKKDTDSVIHTNATEKNNPELLAAKKMGIKIKTYPEALGQLTKKMFTIAVAGMHGKSTTTSMMAIAAISVGLDPTVIVGTKLKEFGDSNFRAGQGEYLIIEADEYKAALLEYRPDIAVVLNLEEEHMDFYKDLKHIQKTFAKFLSQIKPGGTAILNGDDKGVMSLLKNENFKNFSIKDNQAKIVKKVLQVPGEHNLSNAMAVFEALKFLGVPEEKILSGLKKFGGVWRRMELVGKINGAFVYDDYGHHPTEIKATLKAAKQIIKKKGRLWCVFQPHQYNRTFKLFKNFLNAFDDADEVLLLDIYSVPGRESQQIKKQVSSRKLAEKINKKNVRYIESFQNAKKVLKLELKKDDVCLIMGAGDIIKLTKLLLSK